MRNKQGITIAALIIAIIGLSIGFAAFSNTLTIRSSATVNPTNTMNVVFSSSNSAAETNSITPTRNTAAQTAAITATNGSIIESGRTLSNLSAEFTAPGQSVTYNLYVYNAGPYMAYLTNLTMGSITCDAIENQEHPEQEATESLVSDACRGIGVSVTIGTSTRTSSGSLNNQSLSANGGYVDASITISYAEGSAYVDGPMEVTIGDITFTASTVAATTNYPIAGTYNRYMASSQNPTTSLVLNSNGTGTVNMGSSLEGTYEYSSNDSTVTCNIMGSSQQWNYASISGNQIIYTTSGGNMIFATNGSTGITPLEGFTYNLSSGDAEITSYTFGANGVVTDSESNTGTYAVIDGTLYFLIDDHNGVFDIAQDYSQFGDSLNFNTYIKQS